MLKIFRVRSLGGCKWNALFRLCLYLRAAPDGCDSMWLKNPRAKRKRPLTWCQENQQKLKVLQAKATENRDRVRAGRLERWYEQGKKLRSTFSVALPEPDSIE